MSFFKKKQGVETILERAQMKDTILIALIALGPLNIDMLILELRRCGFIITYPEAEELIREIEADGYIQYDNTKRTAILCN